MNEGAFREKLGARLVVISTIALVLLAVTILIGAAYAESRSPGSIEKAAQLLLSSLLPLFATWVGTVLAFYYSKDNFETANRGTLDLMRSVNQRLASTRINDAMMPRGKMVTLDLLPKQTLEDVPFADIANKFQAIGINGHRISRLPVLDESGTCIALVHRGILNEMLAVALLNKVPVFDPATDKLGKLLSQQCPMRSGITYNEFVRGAIAFVARDRSLGDAKAAMEQVPSCQDVIVTEKGDRSGVVLGWLSNIDIGRLSQA